MIKALIVAADPDNGPVSPPQRILQLETIQLCFAKSKILQPEHRLELGAKRRKIQTMVGLKAKNCIALEFPKLYEKGSNNEESKDLEDELAAISAKKINYKNLKFVEWLEFLCRLATCTFVFDSKTASKTRNPAMVRLIEDSRKPLAHQIASFLCTFLEQLLFEHTKRRMQSSQNGI